MAAPETTPTTAQAIDPESMTDTKNVKVEMGKVEMVSPAHDKLAHGLAAVVAGVIALCVGAVLADGTSVIKLKDNQFLPVITNPALRNSGTPPLNYRLDQLLGPTYGIGLHHDQAGYSWTEMGAGQNLAYYIKNLGLQAVIAAVPSVISTDGTKHPVAFASCDDLQMATICAMYFGFIALAVAIVMLVVHVAILAGVLCSEKVKPIVCLVWFVLSAGFLVVLCLASGIYTARWECKQEVIPSIVLKEHFELSYGYYFAIVGYVSAVLIFMVTLLFTATKETAGKVGKAIGGVVVGIVVAVVLCVIITGSVQGFDNRPVDPNVNPCEGKKPYHAGPGDNYFSNVDCMRDGVTQVLEQAGGNVTRGYVGGLDAGDRVPITEMYDQTDLCPVNVHWHLGAEHLNVGEFDYYGSGPADHHDDDHHRQLASAGDAVRLGNRCYHYDSHDNRFNNSQYTWNHCVGMIVGETYEVHWPHSAAGACGTQWQYQTPFYDGVFCRDGIISITPLNTYKTVGVQAQIFTIVNDEHYYYPDLINGMKIDANRQMGQDIAKYTGSTTGTSRDNDMCSRYTPITWQVDRKCHLVSASSFDKMCQDMKGMKDDMSGDLYAHGAREVVSNHLVANNQQSRK